MKEKTQNKKYHYVYKLTHKITGEYYIGSRSTDLKPELDINYKGSMINWKISKDDKIKFLEREILRSDFKNREDAIDYERHIIVENFKLNTKLFKNKYIPNRNFHTLNCVAVKDQNGKNLMVDKEDPRYLSSELIPVRKGKCTMVDSLGNFITIDADEILKDPRVLSGDIKHVRKDKVTVKDKNGINYLVDKEDPRYLSGELVGVSSGLIAYNARLRIGNRVQTARNWSIEFGIENKKLREYLETNEIEYTKLKRYEK